MYFLLLFEYIVNLIKFLMNIFIAFHSQLFNPVQLRLDFKLTLILTGKSRHFPSHRGNYDCVEDVIIAHDSLKFDVIDMFNIFGRHY